MTSIEPTDETLGATVHGLDLATPIDDRDFSLILHALGEHGVLRIPNQSLTPETHKAFAQRFGSLEINVASGPYTEPGHPEVMILSNMKKDGNPLGLGDAGQGWHTDMSYSSEIAFANVLYGIEIPHRDGNPLGGTQFANMHQAYDTLPQELKTKLEGVTATHDFEKFWEMMRQRPGSTRGPLTQQQRAQKPPVSHPVFLVHPITGRKVLYCNSGYATKLDGFPKSESDEILDLLFTHQLREDFVYTHHWQQGDLLIWENIGTIHNALPDYNETEHRYVRRCQVMADKIFDPAFTAFARA